MPRDIRPLFARGRAFVTETSNPCVGDLLRLLQLSRAWTLHRGRKTAKCAVWSHQFGRELRLLTGSELLRSQVVRSHGELVDICLGWRDAMIVKGWNADG
jgi:hypothetical protein